jgi:hypothetical protein
MATPAPAQYNKPGLMSSSLFDGLHDATAASRGPDVGLTKESTFDFVGVCLFYCRGIDEGSPNVVLLRPLGEPKYVVQIMCYCNAYCARSEFLG